MTDVSSDEQLRLQTESLPHGITFPKLILKYLLANESQPHFISYAKGEQKSSFQNRTKCHYRLAFLSLKALITMEHNRCLIKEH